MLTHGDALGGSEWHAEKGMDEGENGLTRAASEIRLSDAVVVEVVRARDAASTTEESDDELREPVELVDGGGEAEVHAGYDEEGTLTGVGIDLGHDGEARGAARTAAVRHLDVLGAAQHAPRSAEAKAIGEERRNSGREVGGITCNGLTEGGTRIVHAAGSVIAPAVLNGTVGLYLLDGEGVHRPPVSRAEPLVDGGEGERSLRVALGHLPDGAVP